MITYIMRRLLLLPVTLLGLTLLIFALQQTLDPAARAALYISQPPKTPGELQRVITKYGLDQPFYVQYGRWLSTLAQGNLGFSVTSGEPVAQAIGTYFPATLELTLFGFALMAVSGTWLGI